MPGKQINHIALYLLVLGVCTSNWVPANAQEQEEVYPDAHFLEYLASLEEVNGEWLGPEQMQYLQEGVRGSLLPGSASGSASGSTPEQLVTPEPVQLSPEQEEKK